MDKTPKGTRKTGKQNKPRRPEARREDQSTPEQLKAVGKTPGGKGTMREPTQAPDQAKGDLEEALQDLEETKGDWSKGG